MKNNPKVLLKKYKFSLTWLVVMTYMLFTPASNLPKGGLFDFDIPHFDKIIHFGLFAGLIFLFEFDRILAKQKSLSVTLLFISASLVFAATSELIQYAYIEGRTGNYLDFLADLAGVLIGIIFIHSIKPWLLVKFVD